ncbi:transketolase [Oceanococcus atlanticus]|uniref:Transketolase n=1 Tax=Oceanococcus atlanticus TaxID=1317117 RepID=A0A1Y1SA01_9GAMM|nr:transketolase [Oceanococcus atlanticus]ORE85173.1 transketolase [Oceanococcus atlanticus]
MTSRTTLANAIRALAMDAVQKANSGHPGMPMGMADMAEVLWNDYLKHNPSDPSWPDRDRFVVSNGHGSMLLYALLHLSGYDLPMEELKNFRQMNSKTPGHPEFGITPGVETTTGPLGQGLANAVGMALGERLMAAEFNRDALNIVDHYTYVFTGDGCLMEGISHEACSLAGTLGLGKLIVLYDDNNISIDGEVPGWFADDTGGRFEAYGWQVIRNVDGHNPEEVKLALQSAREDAERPTLIQCKTLIGFGSPNKQGTESTHGAPLGDDEIAATRQHIGWPHPPFEIPADVKTGWDARERGAAAQSEWQGLFDRYAKAHPELAAEFRRRMSGELPDDFGAACEAELQRIQDAAETVATRKASLQALNVLGPKLPELLGGSADLTGSNLTLFKDAKGVTPDDVSGQYIYYGVREFGMSAIMNGLALHGGFIPYGGTFLTFSDYARNAVRMAALMNQGSIFVYTHDSIGLGEDGPTHQPIEHVASLRLIPNLETWRPCDAVETFAAWQHSIARRNGPAALALTRQNVPANERTADQLAAIERGGYALVDGGETPQAVIMASGSEVELAVKAAAQLGEKGMPVRVVSVPCLDRFMAQDKAWRDSVIPPSVKARLAIEAGVPDSWWRLVGDHGDVVGMTTYGESAPAGELFKHFGFTVDNVVSRMESLLG